MAGPDSASLAARAVEMLGGRYSTELGIDVDRDEQEIERWALAATLFGGRISAKIAQRTFAALDHGGVHTLAEAGRRDLGGLIELLDAGGYARYDLRTARRLHDIAQALVPQHGRVSALLDRTPQELSSTLESLPGWGPVTVGLFLRELRGVRVAIEPPIDSRALGAGEHLGLLDSESADPLARLGLVARDAHVDVRDLEAALVRLSLIHRDAITRCPGGERCALLGKIAA